MKTKWTKRMMATLLCGAMMAGLAACGNSSTDTTANGTAGDEPASNDAGATVTINVGYENATTEPAAQAAEKWKELVEEKSGGSIQLELFPNSTLGKKNDLIDRC